MHTQKQIPCATAQQSHFHTVTMVTELNSYHKTGLASLFSNLPLLAIANERLSDCEIDPRASSLLRSDIQSASLTLSDTLTALSFVLGDVLNDTVTKAEVASHITPQLVAEFAALVGELLPVLHEVSDNIIFSTKQE